MNEQLERIALALEKSNELFAEWVAINRENIKDAQAKRSEMFPLELKRMALEVKERERFDAHMDELKERAAEQK